MHLGKSLIGSLYRIVILLCIILLDLKSSWHFAEEPAAKYHSSSFHSLCCIWGQVSEQNFFLWPGRKSHLGSCHQPQHHEATPSQNDTKV